MVRTRKLEAGKRIHMLCFKPEAGSRAIVARTRPAAGLRKGQTSGDKIRHGRCLVITLKVFHAPLHMRRAP